MYLTDSELEEETRLKILIMAILQRSAAEPEHTKPQSTRLVDFTYVAKGQSRRVVSKLTCHSLITGREL